MAAKRGPRDGRSSDMSFSWMTKNGSGDWEQWRIWLAGWMATQTGSAGVKLNAMVWFAGTYLPLVPGAVDPIEFFKAGSERTLPDLRGLLEKTMSPVTAVKNQNWIVDLLDWVIQEHLTEPDDLGKPAALVGNPFAKGKEKSLITESVHNPLPYAYIRELRSILCPDLRGNFRDWEWAQQQSGQVRTDFGDWYEVDPGLIDREDRDCVWRAREVLRPIGGERRVVTVYEMWSPVRAMALQIKLHLPLRTYQVRFLDSGEADTWRYTANGWAINRRHPFALGKETNPWSRGVFRRMVSHDTGQIMTGLYINTNKTADLNKESRERGYTVPWQNEDVLYWLSKLRNWQEKYNPISGPMACSNLEDKYFSGVKTSEQKRDMGAMCFLFRDPTTKGADREKPITNYSLPGLWYQLLSTLEDKVAARGQTLSNGVRLRFVEPYAEDSGAQPTKTDFPLHSLRVSLLTCYAMEGRIPMAVLSKLIAGHARILMTLHYTRPTPAMVSDAMDRASKRIEEYQHDGLKIFLVDADDRQITGGTAFIDVDSVRLALASRNPIGWEYRSVGLCLVGGNHVRSDEMVNVGGCWNGGELLDKVRRIYGPVPHGDENCVRCRWLVTDATYLPNLVAHLNMLSYKASLAGNLVVELEQAVEEFEDEIFFANEADVPFTREAEKQVIERRLERQKGEANEYASDLVACFQLISKLIAIEEGRDANDGGSKLLAVGTLEDIHQPISLIETTSEMWQLSQICEDAEIYADLSDDLRKTPALQKRSEELNALLLKNGYTPVFMNMDERMQLIAGNAMMRSMAAQASPNDQLEGFRQVANLIEMEDSLHLLPTGIRALEQTIERPLVKLTDLISSSAKQVREVIRDQSKRNL